MDISEYLPMFLAEAAEHLQQLNLAVVRIEDDPDDAATVEEIFRIAHSLKGMSATMGFEGMAALTHQMEDVFELLRQRRAPAGLRPEAVDVLLRCLDALEQAVESIRASGQEGLDPALLVEELKGLVRPRTEEQAAVRQGGAPSPESVVRRAQGRRVVHVRATLADEAMMPSVRAYMAIAAAGDHGEVLGSAPEADAVELFEGRVVDVWVASDHPEEAIGRSVAQVADVAGVDVEEVSPGELAEEVADTTAPLRAAARAVQAPTRKTTSVRVDADRLDQLMHFMGELVVHRTHVESIAAPIATPELQAALQDLQRSSHALQAMVMQVRMMPVEAVFLRFPRLVRDLSGRLRKKVALELVGSETELDRTVVDALGDPLVHLVRNALDHGLETPEERRAAGKPEVGTLEISARHAGGNVVISVRDDGRGIDPERVAQRALERGLITAEQVPSVDVARAAELLFLPGFSTAEQTSDISGRGVGMDAVRTTIRELGGEVLLSSEHGRGTTAQIRLPLTLAIMSALLVESHGLPFAIPLDRVERTLRLADHAVRSVAGARMLVLPETVMPLVNAADVLGRGAAGEPEYCVIVRAQDRSFALAVDRLVGQRELVTRPLPPELAGDGPLAGGAVLASGEIALIVDCDEVAAGTAGPTAALPTAA